MYPGKTCFTCNLLRALVSKASATCDQVQSSSKSKDTQAQLYTNTPTIMCIYLLTPQTVQFDSRLGCHMKGNCPNLPSTGHELHHWTHSSNCCMTHDKTPNHCMLLASVQTLTLPAPSSCTLVSHPHESLLLITIFTSDLALHSSLDTVPLTLDVAMPSEALNRSGHGYTQVRPILPMTC